MNLNKRPEKYIKGGIFLILVVLLFGSIFVLINSQYNLTNLIFEEDVSSSQHSVLAVSSDTQWEYMDEGFEPGIGNIWTTGRYNSQFWKKGKGAFAAKTSNGSSGANQPVVLISQTKQGKNVPTYFFRTTFTVNNLELIKSIQGNIYYSDAIVVYLNGNIIFAGNVPGGGYKSNQETNVAQQIDSVQNMNFSVTDMSSLVEGENILSVEVHQDDSKKADAYFFMESMQLLQIELDEPVIDVSGLVLTPGDSETNVNVNWLTDSKEFYKVEYMEESKYDGEPEHFSKDSESVFLGRHRLPDTQMYTNSGELVRLKYDTNYLYRIVKVGGTKGSEILSFQTAARNGFSFALLGGPQLGANGNDDGTLWNRTINETITSLGKVDFIISAGNQMDSIGSIDDVKETFIDFRSPSVFKQIPIQTTVGNNKTQTVAKELYDKQFNQPNGNEQGNYYFTYQDMLIVGLNSNDEDYVAHRNFLKKAIKSTKRKWVVVTMNNSIFSEGEHSQNDSVKKMRENFSMMFQDMNVDLVLSGHDHIYSRSYLMNGIESVESSKGGKKRSGESLYITAASSSDNKFNSGNESSVSFTAFDYTRKDTCATRINVSETGLQISTYRIKDGAKIDEYLLKK